MFSVHLPKCFYLVSSLALHLSAVSRRPLTTERRVQSRAILCRICEQISTDTGFLRVPKIFPVSISVYHCFVLKFGQFAIDDV